MRRTQIAVGPDELGDGFVALEPQLEEALFGRRVFLVGDERRCHERAEAREQPFDEVAEDVFLAVEVLVEGAFGAARAHHDVVDARGFDATLRELRFGGGEELDSQIWIDRTCRLSTRQSIISHFGARCQVATEGIVAIELRRTRIVAENRPKTRKLPAVGGRRRWLRWALFVSLSAVVLGVVGTLGLFIICAARSRSAAHRQRRRLSAEGGVEGDGGRRRADRRDLRGAAHGGAATTRSPR